ncbi:hypothetical protein MKW92_003336 [Papaver armeniacum]|nr:hypothetical protein MKW92_003336 [Papaver armeniacum]
MKYAAKMEKFVSDGSSEEIVRVSVRIKDAVKLWMVRELLVLGKLSKRAWRVVGILKDYFLGQKNVVDSWKMLKNIIETVLPFPGQIFALPHSSEEFKGLDLPPSDNDAWLYDGEVGHGREIERVGALRIKAKKDAVNDSDLGDIVNSMQSFVQKVSSYEGAEVPTDRNSNMVDLDVECFMKDIKSVMGRFGGCDVADIEEGSFSDTERRRYRNTFMYTYSDALNEELKSTTLKKSFVRANAQPSKTTEDEELTPVDVDVNLVKSLLDSFSSQQGLPGPASNLLGLMGLQLPQPVDDATTHAASKKDAK